MPHFKVAHLREQGQDMVIVPLDPSFDQKPETDQRAFVNDLQAHSLATGLKGIVVPVWESGHRVRFIAPDQWHPFFKNFSMQQIWASVNKEISW